jgi:hypothetical protein
VTGGHPPGWRRGMMYWQYGARPVGVGCYLMLVNEMLRCVTSRLASGAHGCS